MLSMFDELIKISRVASLIEARLPLFAKSQQDQAAAREKGVKSGGSFVPTDTFC